MKTFLKRYLISMLCILFLAISFIINVKSMGSYEALIYDGVLLLCAVWFFIVIILKKNLNFVIVSIAGFIAFGQSIITKKVVNINDIGNSWDFILLVALFTSLSFTFKKQKWACIISTIVLSVYLINSIQFIATNCDADNYQVFSLIGVILFYLECVIIVVNLILNQKIKE